MAVNILVVDNSPEMRETTVDALRKVGYEHIVEAAVDQEALEALEKGAFNLLVTEWTMPDMDGLKLIWEIRTRETLKDLPVMIVTARNAKDDVLDAIQAGVNDYLLKPVDPYTFRRRAAALWSRRTAKRRNPPKDVIDKLPEMLSQDDINTLLLSQSVLSQDEIDALLTATGEEETGPGAHTGPDQSEETMAKKGTKKATRDPSSRPIITYDFKHPRRVSKDQTRTLENLHSNLARMMASSFSTMQRSVVDCDIAFVDQTTYAEFIMSLSNPSCSYTFTIEPLGGPAVIDFSLPVAYSFIDRQFGGSGGNPPSEARPLTSAERTVMGKVVTRTLADLEATWEALLKIQVSDAELETNPEFMQIAAPSDTVMLIAFEVNSQHASGLVNLCYPYFTLEPVMAYLNVQTWASRRRGRMDSKQRQKRLMQLKGIEADVRVQWGQGSFTAEEVTDLRVGDTLVLNSKTDDPGAVFVEDQPLFLARPGTSEKGRHAVEILRAIPQEEATQYV